jgi:predicted CXXCH cytochrome family protein
MNKPLPVVRLVLLMAGLSAFAMPLFAQDCLSNGCHQALTSPKHLHEPAAEGDCLDCHEQKTPEHPAGSGKSFMLSQPVATLCLQCHELERKGNMHTPVTEGECLTCHDPHGADEAYLLRSTIPELCYECHEDIRAEVRAQVRHAAVYRQGSCIICHSGHSSGFPAQLLTDEKDLCLSCHGQDDYTRSDPLRNIGSEIEGKAYLHGPVAEGECSPCHAPHGSDYYRLLRAYYPKGAYAPYGKDHQGTYALCFECHDQDMLNSAKTTSETGFRDGNRNLHFLHVVDPQKGRICTSCHASHASSNASLINDRGVRFGDWAIPVNYQATSTGGRCAPGCHYAAQYDRGKQ